MSQPAGGRWYLLAAGLVLGLGVLLWALGGASVGLQLEADAGGRLVVTDVTTGSLAWAAGARPGMTATSVTGTLAPGTTDVPLGEGLRLVDARHGQSLDIASYFAAHTLVVPALTGSVALLFAAWYFRQRLAYRPSASRHVAPLALAATTPLSLLPAAVFGSPATLLLGAVLWPLSVVPLAMSIAGEAPSAPVTGRGRRVAGLAVLGALALAPLLLVVPGPAIVVTVLREGLVGTALLGPVVLVARTRLTIGRPWLLSSEPVVEVLGLVAFAATPIIIRLAVAAPSAGLAILLVGLWLATGAIVARYVVAPLSALVSRALRQRDVVAAAAEAERRRIATDLHDGPLQSLTLLAYRLDATGDVENAEFARDVVTELRAVTSALRLPVVDDLGAGAALEWLTTQVGRLSGLPIELERADSGRPPLEVEHAIFRIAQEALANAARHGRPPIRVRYEAGPSRASLVVDDAGSGLADLPTLADRRRGFGLVGMLERADSIGAELRLTGSPAGSRVSLVWPTVAS